MYEKIEKKYKCDVCGLEMEKPYRRFVLQKYGMPILSLSGKVSTRKAFFNIGNHDYCKKCYEKIVKIIQSVKEQ